MSSTTRKRNRQPQDTPPRIARLRNPFILFRSAFLRQGQVPQELLKGNRSLSRVIADIWKSLSAEQREPWIRKAAQEKQHHEQSNPGYRFARAPSGPKPKKTLGPYQNISTFKVSPDATDGTTGYLDGFLNAIVLPSAATNPKSSDANVSALQNHVHSDPVLPASVFDVENSAYFEVKNLACEHLALSACIPPVSFSALDFAAGVQYDQHGSMVSPDIFDLDMSLQLGFKHVIVQSRNDTCPSMDMGHGSGYGKSSSNSVIYSNQNSGVGSTPAWDYLINRCPSLLAPMDIEPQWRANTPHEGSSIPPLPGSGSLETVQWPEDGHSVNPPELQHDIDHVDKFWQDFVASDPDWLMLGSEKVETFF